MTPQFMKLGTCARCNRRRQIYNIKRKLCTSCRVLIRYDEHPETYLTFLEKQRQKNPKLREKYNRKYYLKNTEKLKKAAMTYYHAHKERYTILKRRYVANIKAKKLLDKLEKELNHGK